MNEGTTTSRIRSTEGMIYALVGNPNCGKTTIFNALTGLRQRVGNYPGVTVERKEGEFFSQHGAKMRLIDLPGAYSLNARSPDEAVLRDVLLGRRRDTPRPDRVVCVVDAANLERNLYLVTQIIELGLPVIIALNMVDEAEKQGIRVEAARLSERFNVPVVPMVANTKKGLTELKIAMSRAECALPRPLVDAIPVQVRAALVRSRETLAEQNVVSASASLMEPLYLLSGHDAGHYGIPDGDVAKLRACREQIEFEFPQWEDRLVASRYDAIHAACEGVVHRPAEADATFTDKLDRLLLHKVWGWFALTAVLGLIFYLIFRVASVPADWIEGVFTSLKEWITGTADNPGLMADGDLRSLLTDGILNGVSGVLVFLPQILILFLFIGLLEDTGYMARVAFIMDRLMSRVGLNGKSFLPLLSGHACAVPAVMATRTIESARDRLITILVTPFAGCSARLPVYTLLIAALVPAGGELGAWKQAGILAGLYALGIIGAFFFAWLFNRTIMKGAVTPLILELPSYKLPSLRTIGLQMWERSWMFIRRAGTVILGLSILLWAASTWPKKGSDSNAENLAHSYAGRLGHLIEPVIRPLGYDWKIGVGLVSSFAAREVFNSTMSVIYAVEAEEGEEEEQSETRLRDRLRDERRPDGTPVYTPAVCFSLMVFYVFALQCLSTVAVVRRETGGWKWPLFQLGFMTGTAWLAAFAVYQIGIRL